MWQSVASLLVALCLGLVQSQLQCLQVDRCSCLMNDRSGKINLHPLARPDNPYRIDHTYFSYLYSPCVAMSNATGKCKDEASVCQQLDEGGLELNYGTADSAGFRLDPETKQISIHYGYVEGNMSRGSSVDLVCDPAQKEEALFEYEGFDRFHMKFKLTSVCACPGGCPVTCSMKDSCTCDMSDGTGEINLHPLDNPWAPFRSSHLSPDGSRIYTYYYNPCSGLAFGNTPCTNVSGCQVDRQAAPQIFYPLGHHTPEPTAEVDGEGNVVLAYTGGDDGRRFNVTLICDGGQDVPEFTALGEVEEHCYKMTLKTKCACPGLC